MIFQRFHLVIIFASLLVGFSCYGSEIVAGATAAAPSDIEAWNEFKNEFNKSYSSQEEEIYRMKVFIANKHRIENHNTRLAVSFTQGLNPLSDLTTEEINRSRNGFRPGRQEPEHIDRLLETLLVAFNHSPGTQLLASVGMKMSDRVWYEDIRREKLDYRTTGRVSRVKDQGSCGSCWAFSVTGALESILASRNKSALLSEQNLLDCSRNYGNEGCNGGWMDAALRYVRDSGIMSSADYPYVKKEETCKFEKSKSLLQVRGSVTLPRGNELLLRLALSLTGPMPVAIDASANSFHSYKSGIYNDRTCRNGFNHVNHAVLLVGFDTHPVHGDYWIVKNSWGKSWGENGYIRMARNRGNLCGIASYAVLPIQ